MKVGVLTASLYGHQAQGIAPKRMKVVRRAMAKQLGRSAHGSTDTVLDLTPSGVRIHRPKLYGNVLFPFTKLAQGPMLGALA